MTLHKRLSFLLRISSVNVTKSAVSCGLSHILWRISSWKIYFSVQSESSFHYYHFIFQCLSRAFPFLEPFRTLFGKKIFTVKSLPVPSRSSLDANINLFYGSEIFFPCLSYYGNKILTPHAKLMQSYIKNYSHKIFCFWMRI